METDQLLLEEASKKYVVDVKTLQNLVERIHALMQATQAKDTGKKLAFGTFVARACDEGFFEDLFTRKAYEQALGMYFGKKKTGRSLRTTQWEVTKTDRNHVRVKVDVYQSIQFRFTESVFRKGSRMVLVITLDNPIRIYHSNKPKEHKKSDGSLLKLAEECAKSWLKAIRKTKAKVGK